MNRNVTATILIILAVGVYFTMTQGVLDEAKSAKSVNDRYASAVQSAEELIKVRDKVNDAYNNISQNDRTRLDKMMPSAVDNIRLVIDLNNVAAKHGLALKGVKAVVASNNTKSSTAEGGDMSIGNPELDRIKVSFNVDAPYSEFISFMRDLEANLRLMDLTHLSVTSADDGEYSFSMSFDTYWLRQ